MSENPYLRQGCDVAWCPGCGNYGILKLVSATLAELQLDPQQTVFVSGIGQAAKLPQYLNLHYFNGLHGRALPPATAIKASNRNLTVIAESGDGDMYGEGGNHFLHCIRRNPDLTNIVHNSFKFSSGPQETVVTMTSDALGRVASIAVTDRGIGMTRELDPLKGRR